jgi:ketosteroid isomerase-like protein
MKKRVGCLIAFLCLVASAAPPAAPAPEPNAPIHNALRQLRARLVDAINRHDIDGIVAEAHPNVIVTWQDATVSRGPQGIRAYMDKMMKGPNAMVKSYHADINVDELTALYGDNTGIAFGSSVEQFNLAGGLNFTLHGRWSATMVKENGRWLIASVHASSNLFDNPLLSAAKKSLYVGLAVSALVALAIGWLIGRRTSRSRA